MKKVEIHGVKLVRRVNEKDRRVTYSPESSEDALTLANKLFEENGSSLEENTRVQNARRKVSNTLRRRVVNLHELDENKDFDNVRIVVKLNSDDKQQLKSLSATTSVEHGKVYSVYKYANDKATSELSKELNKTLVNLRTSKNHK